MNDLLTDWKNAAIALLGALVGLLGWIGRRELKRAEMTQQDHASRIGVLEKDRVTRDDFDELRSSLTASITGGYERLENSVEKRHQENRDDMTELRADVRTLLQRRGP